jgi:hypothetical protein
VVRDLRECEAVGLGGQTHDVESRRALGQVELRITGVKVLHIIYGSDELHTDSGPLID